MSVASHLDQFSATPETAPVLTMPPDTGADWYPFRAYEHEVSLPDPTEYGGRVDPHGLGDLRRRQVRLNTVVGSSTVKLVQDFSHIRP